MRPVEGANIQLLKEAFVRPWQTLCHMQTSVAHIGTEVR